MTVPDSQPRRFSAGFRAVAIKTRGGAIFRNGPASSIGFRDAQGPADAAAYARGIVGASVLQAVVIRMSFAGKNGFVRQMEQD